MSKALLYDATMCIGCKQCESACAQQNKLLYDDKVVAESVQSAHKYTVVMTKDNKFMRRLCMHCEHPACASACPVGAFHKTKEGPVVYDVWKCIGCRYCMVACAFNQPKYEWGSLNPRVRKCIMCPDRVAAGKQTACAEICPTGATKFGDRDDLIREAQDRIRQNPTTYLPHIYGLNEVGGACVLILSSVKVEEYGYPASEKIGDTPIPEYTGRVMSKIPDFIPVWSLVLGASIGFRIVAQKSPLLKQQKPHRKETRRTEVRDEDEADILESCIHCDRGPGPVLLLHSLFLWPGRDALHFAGQLGGKIIHAHPHQVGALAQCPSVARMVAQILWDLEAPNQGGLEAWHRFLFGCGSLQCRLRNREAGAEVIDQ